jgi:nucleotide-binding universal stress UspA family protein
LAGLLEYNQGVYKRIVVGTDGSESAHRAVRHAAALAASVKAELHIVHAYRPAAVMAMAAASGGGVAAEMVGLDQEAAESVLTQATAVADDAGASTVEKYAYPGEPADALLQVTDALDADLIVVGNRGMSGIRRVLGSVPNRVARTAPVHVLIIHST